MKKKEIWWILCFFLCLAPFSAEGAGILYWGEEPADIRAEYGLVPSSLSLGEVSFYRLSVPKGILSLFAGFEDNRLTVLVTMGPSGDKSHVEKIFAETAAGRKRLWGNPVSVRYGQYKGFQWDMGPSRISLVPVENPGTGVWQILEIREVSPDLRNSWSVSGMVSKGTGPAALFL